MSGLLYDENNRDGGSAGGKSVGWQTEKPKKKKRKQHDDAVHAESVNVG